MTKAVLNGDGSEALSLVPWWGWMIAVVGTVAVISSLSSNSEELDDRDE